MIMLSGGPVSLEEYRMALPAGVSLVNTRLFIDEVSPEGVERMLSQIERGAREIAVMKPDCVVFCGTPAGFVKGHAFNQQLIGLIREVSGLPSTTIASAVVDALRHLKVRRIGVATAYIDELNDLLRAFLEEAGFEVLAIKGLRQRFKLGHPPHASGGRLPAGQGGRPGSRRR
jgi:arylmalonate decarboxylase